MANGRNKPSRKGSGRDAGGFVALPWSVLDSAAYARLSHPARALLLEMARQFVRDNNGRLLASAAHLSKRGWKSADVITRAKRELQAAGFIHETVKGHRLGGVNYLDRSASTILAGEGGERFPHFFGF